MLDFLKDLYLEASGLDMELVKKERKEKAEIEKKETIILKQKNKRYLLVVGMIFITIHILSIVIAIAYQDTGAVFKSGIMIALAVLALICSAIKNKISEILCIVFCGLVILLSLILPNF